MLTLYLVTGKILNNLANPFQKTNSCLEQFHCYSMHSSLAVQYNSLVSQRAECGTLYFILDCIDTLNIPRFTSSSHFSLIRLKGIQFFHCFISLSAVLSSEHSGWC